MRIYKTILVIFIFSISQNINSQDFSDSWSGYFSYLDIKDVSQGDNRIFVAAENAIFIYNSNNNQIETLTTVNGLTGETISSIHYVETQGLLLIGFINGLMQIYIESSGEFITIVDILDKQTIPPNDKEINHFTIYNDLAYISTDYGISIYDIVNFEFGDTYLIGNQGEQIEVNQTTVYNDFIYAATSVGIKKALIDSSNLIDYQQWPSIYSGNWITVQTVTDKLYATRTNNVLYEIINDNAIQVQNYADLIKDVRQVNDNLILTTLKEVFVYNVTSGFSQLVHATTNTEFVTDFTAATISLNEEIFIGTKSSTSSNKPGYGVLKASFDDTSNYEEVHPESPLRNKFFRVVKHLGDIWAVHGGYSGTYNFNGGIRASGISHYKDEEWRNIIYDSIASTIYKPWYLNAISINPINPNQVFVSSYYSGLIEVNDEEVVNIYNQDNSTIEAFVGEIQPTLSSLFDDDENLWTLVGRVDSPLNKFSNGQWMSYDFTSLISNPGTNLGFSGMVKDVNNNNLFIGSASHGVIGFNENNGNPLLKNISVEDANLPIKFIRSLALDNRNQLWIGTDIGLRVLYNTSDFFTNDNVTTEPIIILEDGIPKELLEEQFISDIKVDGSNNKWVATMGAGLFYFSSDGQQTIFHFTKDNSPLPTNNINNLSIDEINGVVYIATDLGLLSFKSGGSSPTDELADAYIYPNPVRPTFNAISDKIKIKDITDNVNIKIVDIEGNLVAEAQSRNNLRYRGYNLEIDGGTAYWNGKNLANNAVASGVYLVMLSDLDTFETKVLKLMIVR